MIVYTSRTGNVRFVVEKLGLKSIELNEQLIIHQPFLLFTYTEGLGDVPQAVTKFMENNYSNCRGIIASGNSNFGHHVFCGSAHKLHAAYNIPIVRKMELRGFQHDYDAIIQYYRQHIEAGVIK